MPTTASNHAKYQLGKKLIDFSADVFKIILMKSGFTFDQDNHAILKDVFAEVTATDIAFADTNPDTITSSSTDFVATGFQAGQTIVVAGSASNDGSYLINSVAANTITLDAGEALVAEGSGASVTLTYTQELAAGNGYTKGGQTLAGVSYTEDDTNNRANATWNDITWTASGGSIGPSPCAIVYDDTVSDDTIMFAIIFAVEKTALDTFTFVITSIGSRIA